MQNNLRTPASCFMINGHANTVLLIEFFFNFIILTPDMSLCRNCTFYNVTIDFVEFCYDGLSCLLGRHALSHLALRLC